MIRLWFGLIVGLLLGASAVATTQPYSAQIQQAIRQFAASSQTVTGAWTFSTSPAGVVSAPAGSTTQVQFNNAGALAGDAGLTYVAATDTLTVGGQTVATKLTGTTGSLGGGALLAAACASGTVTVTGAAVNMRVVATPRTYPGDGAVWSSYVSAADTVTVKVCAIVALTPAASVYDVVVLP